QEERRARQRDDRIGRARRHHLARLPLGERDEEEDEGGRGADRRRRRPPAADSDRKPVAAEGDERQREDQVGERDPEDQLLPADRAEGQLGRDPGSAEREDVTEGGQDPGGHSETLLHVVALMSPSTRSETSSTWSTSAAV